MGVLLYFLQGGNSYFPLLTLGWSLGSGGVEPVGSAEGSEPAGGGHSWLLGGVSPERRQPQGCPRPAQQRGDEGCGAAAVPGPVLTQEGRLTRVPVTDRGPHITAERAQPATGPGHPAAATQAGGAVSGQGWGRGLQVGHRCGQSTPGLIESFPMRVRLECPGGWRDVLGDSAVASAACAEGPVSQDKFHTSPGTVGIPWLLVTNHTGLQDTPPAWHRPQGCRGRDADV